MSYTVTWHAKAENELAAIWMAASDRNAVTQASAELDQQLEDDAGNVGESRAGKRRITFVKPLAIIFEVDEDKRTVVVGQVWEFR